MVVKQGRHREISAMKFIMAFLVMFFVCSVNLAYANQFRIEVQPGVNPAVTADTAVAVQHSVQFCNENFHFQLSQPVTIMIVANTKAYQEELQKTLGVDEVAAARWARTSAAVSGQNKILRNGAAAVSDGDRIFLVAHEMTHQYQRNIGFPSECAWLVEGMADAVAAHVTQDVGRRSVNEYRDAWGRLLQKQAQIPSLSDLSTRQGWSDSLQLFGVSVTYRTAGLTVLQLWDDYGFDKVLEFYRRSITDGPNAAFEAVFGFPLEEFQLRCRLEKAS